MSNNSQKFTHKVGKQPLSYMSLVIVQLCPSSVDVTSIFQLKRVKVSWLSLKTQNRENIDYQSAIRQRRLVQGSPVWNTNRVRETAEIRDRRTRQEHLRIICVGKGRTGKTEVDRRWHTGQVHPTETSAGAQDSAETMDILETDAYDRRQRRNTVGPT